MSNNDMHLSGSGEIAAGDYGSLQISGSGRLRGDVTCRELRASGSARAHGDVRCTGGFRSSGSFHGEGRIRAESVNCSGSFHCEGRVETGTAAFAGSAKLGGGLTGTEVSVSGSVSGADLEAERIHIRGGCDITGLMNAEDIRIELGGACRAGSIGCARLEVRSEPQGILFGLLRAGRGRGTLTVGTIEGDSLDIEYTEADIVRGGNVTVGPGCRIGLVEYSGTLTVDPSSRVGETRRHIV